MLSVPSSDHAPASSSSASLMSQLPSWIAYRECHDVEAGDETMPLLNPANCQEEPRSSNWSFQYCIFLYALLVLWLAAVILYSVLREGFQNDVEGYDINAMFDNDAEVQYQ